MLTVLHVLEGQLRAAIERAFPEASAAALASGKPLDPALGPASKPEFGDFQANGALALAKPLGLPPRKIAEAIVAQLAADPAFLAEFGAPQIAGPGFINLTLRPERLATEVQRRLGDPRLGVPSVGADPQAAQDLGKSERDESAVGAAAVGAAAMGAAALTPVIVDFSSPNIAKEMHVGTCAPRSLATPWRGCWSSAAIRCCASTTWATGAPSSAC
jgi:arginyl-tRNA synthetase